MHPPERPEVSVYVMVNIEQTMKIRVECYAGYRGEETPRAFWLGDHRLEVKEVLDRWLAPEQRYFKVQADDRGIYILRHEVQPDDWELTLFQASGG